MMRVVITDGGRADAGYKGTTGDCVTRAIAIAAGLPYAVVYDAIAERCRALKGKKRLASGRNGTPRAVYQPYLESLGWRWVSTMGIGSGCKVHLDAAELPSGRIIARVSKHLCAVIDGVIYDSFDPQREESFIFEPDHGQPLKEGQGRNENGVFTRVGGRCVYGYFIKDSES